ncbi:hypothetical protein DPMN_106263 [Dreissena polymorpha]|uniref:Uncharacterized protein n=1 Tax=Dreissena polymorpha TaxID=45954 RepID=A0A9D4QJR8_DREPO|nr:hypothetical protein DPMN_106263 [Dreissena polymorpha]
MGLLKLLALSFAHWTAEAASTVLGGWDCRSFWHCMGRMGLLKLLALYLGGCDC